MTISTKIEKFIEKSKLCHGDKCDYSEVDYIHSKCKVIIICPVHGRFLQIPNSHLQGYGCSKCSHNKLSKLFVKTTKTFINESKKIHGDLYDYSIVDYKNNHSPIKIICFKHGIFNQSPLAHLQQKHGCPKCSNNISKLEIEFLNYLNITERSYRLKEWKLKPVDGYDPKTNTVYEFLGDYWHGNPKKYNFNDINRRNKSSFGELYKNTFETFYKIKSLGYNIKYIWESDWVNFKNKLTNVPDIQTF